MRYLNRLLKFSEFFKPLGFRGVSLVEAMVGAGLLGGVALLALKQSDMMGQSSRSSKENMKLIELQSEMSNFLSNVNYCEENFPVSTPVPSQVGQLTRNGGEIVYQNGMSFHAGMISIESMRLQPSAFDDGLELEVSFKKASGQDSRKKFPLFAEPNAAKNQVAGCFSFSESMGSTVKEIVAKKLCANGQGDLGPDEKTCFLKGFPSTATIQDCAQGESVRTVAYDSGAQRFVATCGKTFTELSCPSGWVKKIKTDGSLECADLIDYVDTGSFTFAKDTTCKLKINASNKVAMECL